MKLVSTDEIIFAHLVHICGILLRILFFKYHCKVNGVLQIVQGVYTIYLFLHFMGWKTQF